MKVLLVICLTLSLSAPSFAKPLSVEKQINITQMRINDLHSQLDNLKDIHVGASRLASLEKVANYVGVGLTAFLGLSASMGLGGVIAATPVGAVAVNLSDKNVYDELKEILQTEYFTQNQKDLIADHMKEMEGNDEKTALLAEINLIKLIQKQTTDKISAALDKPEYDIDGGSWLLKPKRTADYLDLQIVRTNFELSCQNKILDKLKQLQKLN